MDLCPTKPFISMSPLKISISPLKTESWVEAWFISKNYLYLHSKWVFNDSQLPRQNNQLRNLPEEHHDLSCFYLDRHWGDGESLLANLAKDVACSSWVCSGLGGAGLPSLFPSMAFFLKGQIFPWTGPWSVCGLNPQVWMSPITRDNLGNLVTKTEQIKNV